MAYKIIKRLKEKKQHNILLQLKEGLIERDIKKGQKHKVFEDSFDANLSSKLLTSKDKLYTF